MRCVFKDGSRGGKQVRKRELEKFKKLLLEERDSVVEEVHRENESLSKSQRDSAGDLSGYAFHMADAGTDAYQRNFAANMITAEQKILFEIDEALVRIKDRVYGVCQKCKRSISKERLLIVSYARLCRRCMNDTEEG